MLDATAEILARETADGVRRRYGATALEALPAAVDWFLKAWNLDLDHALPGGRTAAVVKVTSPHGPAVLKVAPDERSLARGAAALEPLARVSAGPTVYEPPTLAPDRPGAPQLAGFLLSLVGDGRNLRDHGGPIDNEDQHLVDLLTQVRAAGSQELDLDRCGPLPSLYDHLAPRLTGTDLETLRYLTDTTPTGHWVHATMHPGNIVVDADRLWAVDPRPMVGDPAFDVAEVALKRVNERNGHHEHSRNFDEGTATRLAIAMGEDEGRVISWMQVLAASGA